MLIDALAATAMHAVENNYRTVLIEDACRGVNEKQIEVKRLELNENGCIFVDSNVVSERCFSLAASHLMVSI